MDVSQVAPPAAPQLTAHWVPVVGADGDSRLEAVWTAGPAPLAAGHAA